MNSVLVSTIPTKPAFSEAPTGTVQLIICNESTAKLSKNGTLRNGEMHFVHQNKRVIHPCENMQLTARAQSVRTTVCFVISLVYLSVPPDLPSFWEDT